MAFRAFVEPHARLVYVGVIYIFFSFRLGIPVKNGADISRFASEKI